MSSSCKLVTASRLSELASFVDVQAVAKHKEPQSTQAALADTQPPAGKPCSLALIGGYISLTMEKARQLAEQGLIYYDEIQGVYFIKPDCGLRNAEVLREIYRDFDFLKQMGGEL